MARLWPLALAEFDRALDELLDDLLIKRWRDLPIASGIEQAVIVDHGDRYEVRLETGEIDPKGLEVEVAEHRLTVRAPARGGGVTERSFSFTEAIDRDAVTARLSERRLTVVLPRQRSKR